MASAALTRAPKAKARAEPASPVMQRAARNIILPVQNCWSPQQLRQLGEVRRHAAGLVLAEQLGRRAARKNRSFGTAKDQPATIDWDRCLIFAEMDDGRQGEPAA